MTMASAAVYLCYYVQRIMGVTLFTSGEADTRERPITTDTSMHRWVGAALSGALKPKPGLRNCEQKRFRMHIGVINTPNRFSLPFPKLRLGFNGPDSPAPTPPAQRYMGHQALHRCSAWWCTKTSAGLREW